VIILAAVIFSKIDNITMSTRNVPDTFVQLDIKRTAFYRTTILMNIPCYAQSTYLNSGDAFPQKPDPPLLLEKQVLQRKIKSIEVA
jgi:hypothetical protein